MDAGTKVASTAVVCTNLGAPKSEEFGEVHTLDANGVLQTVVVTNVMADAFTHSGIQNHAVSDRADAAYIQGTYDGAPGTHRCEATCSSTNDGKGSPSASGGTWIFTPDEGAMVSQPDSNYLYFGWWLRKDDGDPTSASAFSGIVGGAGGNGQPTTPDGVALTGNATYSGHAAGKFAINNPLGGSDAGHFTADATLTATFGTNDAPNNGGVSGTINNFMANDKSVPWSVALNRAPWGTTGAFMSVAANAANTIAEAAVWSIDGNAAAESGSWGGQVYDEMPGDPPTGDGSNVPTTVTGTFQSHFGSTHTMVGGFGAERQ